MLALEIVVEDAADAARLAAVRDEEVLVGPALEPVVGVGRVAVAGGLQPGVERRGVGLVRVDRVEVGTAAEPGLAGADVARVHVRRGAVRRAQMRHQRDAAGPEPAVALGPGHLLAELGAELAPDRGDVHAHLLEHAAAHERDHAAAAAGPVPGPALEAPRGDVAVRGARIIVLDRLERGADPVAQLLEPGARHLGLVAVRAAHALVSGKAAGLAQRLAQPDRRRHGDVERAQARAQGHAHAQVAAAVDRRGHAGALAAQHQDVVRHVGHMVVQVLPCGAQ